MHTHTHHTPTPHTHTHRTRTMIERAIQSNDFLRKLDKLQIHEIIDCMFSQEFKEGQFVCREGAVGTEMYVIASGKVEVTKNGNLMGPGMLFGELAILYNCTRTATVKADTTTKVHTHLHRHTFIQAHPHISHSHSYVLSNTLHHLHMHTPLPTHSTHTHILHPRTQVWTMDRNSFQTIMRNTGMVRQNEYLAFLRR